MRTVLGVLGVAGILAIANVLFPRFVRIGDLGVLVVAKFPARLVAGFYGGWLGILGFVGIIKL